jgi:hypothetical protein
MKLFKLLTLPALLATTHALAKPSRLAHPLFIDCQAHGPTADIAASIELQAAPGSNNVYVTIDGESTWLAEPMTVTYGLPHTRLDGITWYQVGLQDTLEIDALVASEADAQGAQEDRGSSITLDGTFIPATCVTDPPAHSQAAAGAAFAPAAAFAPDFDPDENGLDSCDPGCHLDIFHHRIPTCVCPQGDSYVP